MGVAEFTSGEFILNAEVQQQDVGHFVRLDGNLGEIELFASGSTDSIPIPTSVNYDFSITGPDAGAIAELAGIDNVAATPFQVSGEYSREHSVIGFDEALLRVGQNEVGFSGDIDLDITDAVETVGGLMAAKLGLVPIPGASVEVVQWENATGCVPRFETEICVSRNGWSRLAMYRIV